MHTAGMQQTDEEAEHSSPFYTHAQGSFGPPNGVGSGLPGQRPAMYPPERAGSSSIAGSDVPAQFYRGMSSQLSGLSMGPGGSGLSYESEASPRRMYRQHSDGAYQRAQPHPRPAYAGGRGGSMGDLSGGMYQRYPGTPRGPYGGRGPPGMVRELCPKPYACCARACAGAVSHRGMPALGSAGPGEQRRVGSWAVGCS